MPRHAAGGAGALLIAAAVSAAALAAGQTPSQPLSARAAPACGVERWPVKTLSDAMAGWVSFVPHQTSVRALRRLRPPSSLPQDARVRPVETRTYRVHARLVESKLEDDSDFHLVIADLRTGGTMIVEFPAVSCTLTAKPVLRRRMQAARLAFIRACGFPLVKPLRLAARCGDDHRRLLLRLPARADRRRPERDRIPPRDRLQRSVPTMTLIPARVAALALLATVVLLAAAVRTAAALAPAQAEALVDAVSPALFKNCDAVHRRYPHGIGKLLARDHTSGEPVTTFKRSTTLYNLAMSYNRGLDRDKDGIACEQA
jgi:Excalibur calcium-binding domain